MSWSCFTSLNDQASTGVAAVTSASDVARRVQYLEAGVLCGDSTALETALVRYQSPGGASGMKS